MNGRINTMNRKARRKLKFKIEEARYELPIPIGKIEADRWKFLYDYSFSLKIDGLWENFFFKKGTITDLGSVPQRLQGLVNPGTSDPFALILYLAHDCGYATHIRNRRFYDKLLSNGLKIDGLNGFDPWDGFLVWWAVKWGGSKPWKARVDYEGYKHITMEPVPIHGLPVAWTR